METEYGDFQGDVALQRPLRLQGNVQGSITVEANGALDLRGSCTTDLIIRPGAEAKIYGTVGGNVINHGGAVKIHGTIKGNVITHAGDTQVLAHATVEGSVSATSPT